MADAAMVKSATRTKFNRSNIQIQLDQIKKVVYDAPYFLHSLSCFALQRLGQG